MSTRQLNLGDFAAHCLEEIKSVQDGKTVLEILSGGKIIAVVNPGEELLSASGMLSSTQPAKPNGMSAQDYARIQGILPVTDLDELRGPASHAQDWEGFDEILESWRDAQPVTPLACD